GGIEPELSIAREVHPNPAAVVSALTRLAPDHGQGSRFEFGGTSQDVFEQLTLGGALSAELERHQIAAAAARGVGARRSSPRRSRNLQLEIRDLDMVWVCAPTQRPQRVTRKGSSNQRHPAILQPG